MNLQAAYYESRFEILFLRCKGDAFQSFFEQLMGLAYREDFIACRPWGKVGDQKNDGFLKSERRLFQVYAPNNMTAADAKAKINEDFEGAKANWGKHFDKWSFVHNAYDGLSPQVIRLLLDFEKANTGMKLDQWCLGELRTVFRRIGPGDLAAWLGLVPTEETRAKLGFGDLQVVLMALAAKPPPPDEPVSTVPPGKIEANDLSESVATLLKSGLIKTSLVTQFFRQWHDETLGERLAVAFRREYGRLRGTMHPNLLYSELQDWVGGQQRGTAEHQMAVLTVLTYYFERCDIFEEPKVCGA